MGYTIYLLIYLFMYLFICLSIYLFIYSLSQEFGTLESIKLIILVLLKPKGLKIIPYVEETKLIKS